MFSLRRILALLTCVVGPLFLGGCEKPTVNVNLHGVNYSGETFSYDVADPATPDKVAGGELIDPFGAGGTTCCITLPKKWHPGIKLQVRTKHWLKKLSNGSLAEIKQEYLVDVPRYVDSKPGELWVLREGDGKVSVISSDFQPDHPNWPGKVKGWPIPSIEYQCERWALYKKHEEEGVELYLSLLTKLKKSPQAEAEEAWEYSIKNDPAPLNEYSGPNDPKYRKFLESHYLEGLEESRKRLKRVMEARP